jgi:hypothetical protein
MPMILLGIYVCVFSPLCPILNSHVHKSEQKEGEFLSIGLSGPQAGYFCFVQTKNSWIVRSLSAISASMSKSFIDSYYKGRRTHAING